MQQSLILVCMLTLLTLSCKKEHTGKHPLIEGTYSGTFQRKYIGTEEISKIVISFKDGKYTGKSNVPGHPSICYGTYHTDSSGLIFFGEECIRPGRTFENLVIMSRYYKIERLSGDKLEFIREYPDGFRDVYVLTRQ